MGQGWEGNSVDSSFVNKLVTGKIHGANYLLFRTFKNSWAAHAEYSESFAHVDTGECTRKMSGRDSAVGTNTSSNEPKMLDSRVFIGNLPSEKVSRKVIEELFAGYGNILGVSLHKSYGFVQFENEEDAKKAVEGTHKKLLEGNALGKE